MSWFFSPAWVDLCSRLNILDTKSCAALKETHIVKPCLKPVRKTAASNPSPSSLTSTSSMENLGVESWIQYLRDSRAKDSVSQTANAATQDNTPLTSGQKQHESSTKYVQAELFSKTSPALENTSEPWPEILGISGMIVDGQYSALELQAHGTLENGGGAWPTPQARDWKSGHGPRYINKERSNDLNDAVDHYEYYVNWPTPTVSDSGGGIRPAQKGEKGWYNVNKDGTRWGAILRDAVPAHEKTKGRLNPAWVEHLMGWPVNWTSLDPIDPSMLQWWEETMATDPTSYWEKDPADLPKEDSQYTPRLSEKNEYRKERLMACGNGQVPQQVLLALKMLL